MNISYNAALVILMLALNSSMIEAKWLLLEGMDIKVPADRDAPCVPASALGHFIRTKYTYQKRE